MEQEEQKQKKIYYPWVLLLLICIALGCYFACPYLVAKNKAPEYKIAVVDVQAIMKKHKDYTQLSLLQQQLKDLQQQMADVNKEIDSFKDVDLKDEIFSQSLNTEENLVDFQKENTLQNESISKAQAIKNSLAPALAQEEHEVNQRFGAKIVSIQLKLDNRDKMLLTGEQINQLKADLLKLENQRFKEVEKVRLKYSQQAAAELAQWQAKRRVELGIKAEADKAVLAKDNAQRQNNAEDKTKDLVANLQKVMGLKSQLMGLDMATKAKARDVELMESSIRADIASYATKVAIENHYDLVMVKNIKSKYPLDGPQVASKGIDITDKVEDALLKAGIIQQ